MDSLIDVKEAIVGARDCENTEIIWPEINLVNDEQPDTANKEKEQSSIGPESFSQSYERDMSTTTEQIREAKGQSSNALDEM